VRILIRGDSRYQHWQQIEEKFKYEYMTKFNLFEDFEYQISGNGILIHDEYHKTIRVSG